MTRTNVGLHVALFALFVFKLADIVAAKPTVVHNSYMLRSISRCVNATGTFDLALRDQERSRNFVKEAALSIVLADSQSTLDVSITNNTSEYLASMSV
jgi:hypothetical protein